MIDHDGDDERKSGAISALLAAQFPDFDHVPQQLQGREPVVEAFVFKQKIDQSFASSVHLHLVEQVRVVPRLAA